jgi:hypothetical protein
VGWEPVLRPALYALAISEEHRGFKPLRDLTVTAAYYGAPPSAGLEPATAFNSSDAIANAANPIGAGRGVGFGRGGATERHVADPIG